MLHFYENDIYQKYFCSTLLTPLFLFVKNQSALQISENRMKPLKLSATLIKLTSLLNDGQYHDEITLSRNLNISRSTILKNIKKLISYGIKIDSIKDENYALREPLILLNKNTIQKNISCEKVHVEIIESITSTNDYLKSCSLPEKILFCVAEQQTAGKGRLERQWHSPFGQNIYLSCRYPFQMTPGQLAGLSLITSLAMIKTCNQYLSPQSVKVKWPNDIIFDEKKLGGNLIEIQSDSPNTCVAIIGIGLNVNMSSTNQGQINQAWTSLKNITNQYIDRNLLLINLISNLLNYLNRFEQYGLTEFITEWHHADYLFNKKITLHCMKNNISGLAQGINHHGHLLIKTEEGLTKAYASGDSFIVKDF